MSTFSEEIESQQDLDFSTDDNDVHFKKESPKRTKKSTNCSSTKVKARHLLTNVAYRRYKANDFDHFNFIVDILSFLLQNFNPINLDRKVDQKDERQMVKFLWESCLPHEFTRLIYTSPMYQTIADPKFTYQKANKIVIEWFSSFEQKAEVAKKIRENFSYIHFIYSLLYPKIYNRINQFGIQNKSNFELAFSLWKVNKSNQQQQRSISILLLEKIL